MATYKTNELTHDLLNQAVAKAIGLESIWVQVGTLDEPCDPAIDDFSAFNPVADWAQCGELIERFKIDISHNLFYGSCNCSCYSKDDENKMLVKSIELDLKTAICRCAVKSVFGDEVEL